MFRRSGLYTTIIDNDILVAIVTNNFQKVKDLINRQNINKIIDNKNNYTALHYAVTLPNNDITKYLLEMGADPMLKQNEGYDCYELSLRSGKKYIFDYFKNKQTGIIENLETDNAKLTIKIDDLRRTNEYLNKSIDELNQKIVISNRTIESKNKEINKLKRDLEESESAFENLLKKSKK
jgi:ankyrin repeat protein